MLTGKPAKGPKRTPLCRCASAWRALAKADSAHKRVNTWAAAGVLACAKDCSTQASQVVWPLAKACCKWVTSAFRFGDEDMEVLCG